MNNLVIGALQKGRIYRGKGLEPFRRQPGGKGYAMLFGNADIEAPAGNASANLSRPVPDGMAAVMPTILSSWVASAISALANTDV